MAYYENAPKKRGKAARETSEVWEEEGSRYTRSGSEKRGTGAKKRTEGGETRGRTAGDSRGRAAGDSRSRTRKPAERGAREGAPAGRNGTRGESGKGRPEKRTQPRREDFAPDRPGARRAADERAETEAAPRTGYQDFEYRKEPDRAPAVQEEEQDHILCGRNPIREALRSGREIEKILVQKGELSGSAREIVQTARDMKIMVQEADKRRLDEIAPHHQGLIAFASSYEYSTVDEMLEEAEKRHEAPFLVILDGVTDPHNLGAVIRTAECTGAHGVIIPVHRSVGLTPSAVKASAGAVEYMKVARVTNLNRTIDELKRKGLWIYAVTMDGKDYEKVDFRGGTALVVGAEGEGISRLTAEKCDLKVSLPMKGSLDSLNASVAAGVMMYRVLSSRRAAKG